MQIKDGNIVCRFNSLSEAANSLGKKYVNNIAEVCKKKRKTAYGFQWRYEGSESN